MAPRCPMVSVKVWTNWFWLCIIMFCPTNLEPSCIHQSRSLVHLQLVFSSCCSVAGLSIILLYYLTHLFPIATRQVYCRLASCLQRSLMLMEIILLSWQASWWCRCILKECGSSSDAPASTYLLLLPAAYEFLAWKRKCLRLAINHSIFVVAYF